MLARDEVGVIKKGCLCWLMDAFEGIEFIGQMENANIFLRYIGTIHAIYATNSMNSVWEN